MIPVELSVIVPAYNEAGRIAPTLRAIAAWLDRVPASELIGAHRGAVVFLESAR